MSFKVNKDQWDTLSAEDQAFIRDHVRKGYPDPDTYAEDITLPSGKEFRIFCDGRGFLAASPWECETCGAELPPEMFGGKCATCRTANTKRRSHVAQHQEDGK